MIERLVGPRVEVDIQLEGKLCQTLLDLGSQVSTVSEDYYNQHLAEITELHPLADILEVEDAGEHQLQYLGYIEVDIVMPESGDQHSALFLVVPTTKYHHTTPCLLGTNVIRQIVYKLKEGSDMAHTTKDIPSAWEVAYRCVKVYDQQLIKNNGEVATVKNDAQKTVSVQSNQTVTITGRVSRAYCHRQSVIVHHTDRSVLPTGVEIAPAVYSLKATNQERIQVTVSNLTSNTVVIPPSAHICSLEAVDIEDFPELPEVYQQEGKRIDFDLAETEKNLSSEEMTNFCTKLQNWEHLFSVDDMDLGCTSATKHKIVLTDERPFKQRCRRIPTSMFTELQQHLKTMLDSGVIRKSHSPWASNIVLVKKKDGKLRFCIDFRKLNDRTVKDSYAIPRMDDTLDLLHGKKWFSCLDLKSGYWQVEMEETSKACTAFTVGPLGLYECNRLPFGLTNSPATFQRLMETVLEGLNLQICLGYLDAFQTRMNNIYNT